MSNHCAEFQVAILMSDIVEAKKVSDELREMGFFAHYYSVLDEFWLALNADTPDLCIVDVTLMSQGTLLFKNHPKVKNSELQYCFYYKESTKTLLSSTFGLDHYGLLRSDINVSEQLRSVLQRRNSELRLEEESRDLKVRLDRLKLRSKRITEVQAIDHNKKQQHNILLDLLKGFGVVHSPNEFMNRMITLFEGWDACREFGVYHLNQSGQKLISPKVKRRNYRILPDLWLASENNDGITDYAKSMAHDVTYGLIEGELSEIKVRGNKNHPDILILAEFDKEKVQGFDWDLLEMKLESEYRSSLIQFYKRDLDNNFEETIFKTFERMDDIQFHQIESEYRFALVDFKELVKFASSELSNRFHWSTFSRELTAGLVEVLNNKFKIAALGCDKFIVSLDRSQIDTEFFKLKNFAQDFEVWSNFEDSTALFPNNLGGEVKFITPSSINTMRLIDESVTDFMKLEKVPAVPHRYNNALEV